MVCAYTEQQNSKMRKIKEKAAMEGEMNRRVVYGSEDLVKNVEKEYKVGAVIRLKGRPKKEEKGEK